MTQTTGFGPYWPSPSPSPRKEAKRAHWLVVVLIGVLCFLMGVGCGVTSTANRAQSAPAPTRSAPVTPRPAPTAQAPVGPVSTFTDGTYQVGRDIAAGTYAAPGGSNCYWARYSDASGESIIANDWSPGHGQVIAEAKAGEYLKVSNCGIWLPR